jgi:hypothetical protein
MFSRVGLSKILTALAISLFEPQPVLVGSPPALVLTPLKSPSGVTIKCSLGLCAWSCVLIHTAFSKGSFSSSNLFKVERIAKGLFLSYIFEFESRENCK